MALVKLTKSWVRLPNSRLIRGYRKHPSDETKEKETPEKQTWEAPAATAVIRVRALSVISVRVENLGEDGVKKRRWKGTEIKTDLNRPKKETGLRSSATGLGTFTSMVVGSPVEVMEGESRFSDCSGLSQF